MSSDLTDLFSKLSEFYQGNQHLWDEISDLYNALTKDNQESQDDILKLDMVQATIANPQTPQLSTMNEICNKIRSLCDFEVGTGYTNPSDCWNQLINIAKCDAYQSYMFSLMGLHLIDKSYLNIAIVATSTYLLSLTIPGSKQYIFDEEMFLHSLKIFNVLDALQRREYGTNHKGLNIWINFVTLGDDLKMLLRYFAFKDSLDAKNALIKRLLTFQRNHHELGYTNKYAADFHIKTFDILYEMLHIQNGDPEESLMQLMKYSMILHVYQAKPKRSGFELPLNKCEHISDWFVEGITRNSRSTIKALRFYSECVVTNPKKDWKNDQIQRALEYAAKYDAALFSRCNESMVDYVCDALFSDEVSVRIRTVDLIGFILQMDSAVDWNIYTHEISEIPREVHLIRALIENLRSVANQVRLKTVQALQAALQKGSKKAKAVLTEGIKFARFKSSHNEELRNSDSQGSSNCIENEFFTRNSIDFDTPPSFTFQGHGILSLSFLNLPQYIYQYFLLNDSSYFCRRAGLSFLEDIVKLNPLVIFDTPFEETFLEMSHEPVALVRRQVLITADSLLASYPNCLPLIRVWCTLVAPSFCDADQKLRDSAFESFERHVLKNIRMNGETQDNAYLVPWHIIQSLVIIHDRNKLQESFHNFFPSKIIGKDILNKIESHLIANHSTEAWILLSLISSKAVVRDPDHIITLFTTMNRWNHEHNIYIALDVMHVYLNHFSRNSLNLATRHITEAIHSGNMVPSLISKAFNFLVEVDLLVKKDKKASREPPIVEEGWQERMNECLEKEIIDNIEDFTKNSRKLISYFCAYSEVNIVTRDSRPNPNILRVVLKFIEECLKLPEAELNSDNEHLLNMMIICAGRFSILHVDVCDIVCKLLRRVLRVIEKPTIVNTVIVVLTDLCKKHTQTVESVLDAVLMKLNSPYHDNKVKTFNSFRSLVMRDQLRMRGSLLLAMLITLLDEDAGFANLSLRFFDDYIEKKNPTLFHKCLIESPYVFNDCTDFEGLDTFSESSIRTIECQLSGSNKHELRQKMYDIFIKKMNDVDLILYFGELERLADKSRYVASFKSSNGINMLIDILYILTRICETVKEQKQKDNNDSNRDESSDIMAELMEPETLEEQQATPNTSKKSNAVKTPATGCGRGRGRRRHVATMSDALTNLEKSVNFIPVIYKNYTDHKEELQKHFDKLGEALAVKFLNSLERILCEPFWVKYREAAKKIINKQLNESRAKSQKSKSKKAKCADDDDDEISINDDDNNSNLNQSKVENTNESQSNKEADFENTEVTKTQKKDQSKEEANVNKNITNKNASDLNQSNVENTNESQSNKEFDVQNTGVTKQQKKDQNKEANVNKSITNKDTSATSRSSQDSKKARKRKLNDNRGKGTKIDFSTDDEDDLPLKVVAKKHSRRIVSDDDDDD